MKRSELRTLIDRADLGQRRIDDDELCVAAVNALPSLLARLDMAERLLGDALRVVEDCASAAPHETITSIRTEDARGKPVWLQAMAAELCEPIATFLAAKE